MRGYLGHVDIFQMAKGMYDKKVREEKRKQLDNNGLLDLSKVTDRHLEEAGVSLREFD
jgi:hypothetical protein